MAIKVDRLKEIIEELKDDLGSGFVSTDIWATADAQSLVGFNSQPKAVALFNEVTRMLDKTLKGAEFPGLGDYYLVHLDNDHLIVILSIGDYQQSVLVDLTKTTMGILMNVALPKVLKGLEEATS